MRRNDGDWCVLRVRPAHTLKLAASLQAVGLEAWTPLEWISRRVPRGKAKERFSYVLTPTYVFVRARHEDEVRRLEKREGTGHPRFSLFRYYQEVVYLPHLGLHALRRLEQNSYVASLPNTGRTFAKERGQPFDVGANVTFKEGPMAGLPCYVESSDDRTTTLLLTLFGRSAGVKVDTCRLRAKGVATMATAA